MRKIIQKALHEKVSIFLFRSIVTVAWTSDSGSRIKSFAEYATSTNMAQ
ncbi:hypothetical protein CES86_3951 [Brucella lupini]|uniref:Uncharacterized protein n=1 Tax=Brucella lupini TaxID=255457 RepID=A0A256GH73_9HYPH|nr:hypothetical protein CES86_3951 [Brucella lupini]